MKVLDFTGTYKEKDGEAVVTANPKYIDKYCCIGFEKVVAHERHKDALKGVENVSFVKVKTNAKTKATKEK